MATITKIRPAAAGNLQGATAFGNMAVLHYTLECDSTGAPIGADSREPLKKDDVLRLGIIPAGFRIFDSLFITHKTMNGGGAKCGFIYMDGADDARVPHGTAMLHGNVNTAVQGKIRTGGFARSFATPKAAHLTFTVGEDNDKESFIEIFLFAMVEGAR